MTLATPTGPLSNRSRHRVMLSLRSRKPKILSNTRTPGQPSKLASHARAPHAFWQLPRDPAVQSSHGQRYGSSMSHMQSGGDGPRLAPRGHRLNRRPGRSRNS